MNDRQKAFLTGLAMSSKLCKLGGGVNSYQKIKKVHQTNRLTATTGDYETCYVVPYVSVLLATSGSYQSILLIEEVDA